ncbi:NAC domain-containing protein 73-like [Panicum miliaceum]|uniref:NAC domain-containing protein 73-like n=1 Tax=Panicum miliaceum TaxID=4540 RepID=A0A3L6RRL7_PANMI|nr:NAC domain-containing protein 73-like [Panicum miliaceum]
MSTDTSCPVLVVSIQLLLQDEGEPTISIVSMEDDAVNPAWCAGAEEQQAVGGASRAQLNSDEPLLCREDSNSLNDEALLPLDYPILSQCRNEILDRNLNTFYGLPDLHNVDLGTPPDLQLGDLQFGSQESLGSWLDRI